MSKIAFLDKIGLALGLRTKFDATNANEIKASVNALYDEKEDVGVAAGLDVTILSEAKSYADGLVVGLWDDRGNFDASVNTYPTTGGSGTAGAILKGDIWKISVIAMSGDLLGYGVGSTVRALVDIPAQTGSNWAAEQNLSGYVPENSANKGIITGNEASETKYPHIKAIVDYFTQSKLFSILGITTLSGSNTGDQTKIANIIGGNSTTLKGSIPYQNDTDTTLLLSPNTTTTKKFLRQTGDGTNGIAPAWDVLSISDLPNLLNLNLNQVISAGVLTSAINATSGNLNGSYNYVVTFITATGETDAKNISTTVSPVNQKVDLTNIPISSDPTVTARKIYRNTAANYTVPTTLLNLVCTISDNMTTTYTDNIADGSLGVSVPRINTTGGNILIGSQIIATTNQNTTSFGINSLLYNTGYANTSFGTSCLANNTIGLRNSAFGLYALAFNSVGNLNAAFGVHSLNYNTTGSNNTAFGTETLQANISASGNTAVGTSSMYFNTTGSNNTGIGFSSLINNINGYSNVGVGVNSLYHNTSGYVNTAVGAFSLEMATTAHNNSAFGAYALQATTTASNNVGVGANALTTNTIGSGNVAMGINSMQNSVTPSNNTIIGFFSGQNISQSVTAGSFIVGVSYTILSAGTTDFTLIGAANSTVGTVFTATGVGAGTGTASSNSNGNTAIGYMAGRYIANGSTALISPTNCTYIGTNSFAGADGVTNETAIGYGAIGKGSNTMSFGNSSITDNWFYGKLHLQALNTAPASAGATGVLGEIRVTATHIYVCTATNTWVRSELTTW